MTKNELVRWLKSEVEFLTTHPDYEGSYITLDDVYAVVISAINNMNQNNLGVCIRLINRNDSCAYWEIPWNEVTGDILYSPIKISIDSNFDVVADKLFELYRFTLFELNDVK